MECLKVSFRVGPVSFSRLISSAYEYEGWFFFSVLLFILSYKLDLTNSLV